VADGGLGDPVDGVDFVARTRFAARPPRDERADGIIQAIANAAHTPG
jgi:hypothetical protein